jgi:hypothetical protein
MAAPSIHLFIFFMPTITPPFQRPVSIRTAPAFSFPGLSLYLPSGAGSDLIERGMERKVAAERRKEICATFWIGKG